MVARYKKSGQSGEALIMTLLVLVVLYLGFLYTMRQVMSDTQMAGNNLALQKNAQTADIALRQLETLAYNAGGAVPLEISGPGQPWYRVVTPGVTAGPDRAYWQTCLGNASLTSRCGAIPVSVGGTTLPYTALAVVQATGRDADYNCQADSFRAHYYDVFIYVQESSGLTSATSETVIKLCIPNS